jgi:AcrR family transcriptional regulator
VTPRPASRQRPYHHGGLPEALIGTAIEMIAERGVRAFSLSQASRRLGVSATAPYRHFHDRETLLAAVAARACGTLSATLHAAAGHVPDPAQRLAALSAAYVQFAFDQRALFEVLFGSGLVKDDWPELQAAAQPVIDAFLSPCTEVCGGPGPAAQRLATAIAASAHGHASMLIDQARDASAGILDARARASAAARALVAGRAALSS